MRTRFDIGEIIRCHGGEFLSKHHAVPAVERAFWHMAQCRTSALGGHVEVCPECGDMHISYNSCRDRHCPKCQNKERSTIRTYTVLCLEVEWISMVCGII